MPLRDHEPGSGARSISVLTHVACVLLLGSSILGYWGEPRGVLQIIHIGLGLGAALLIIVVARSGRKWAERAGSMVERGIERDGWPGWLRGQAERDRGRLGPLLRMFGPCVALAVGTGAAAWWIPGRLGAVHRWGSGIALGFLLIIAPLVARSIPGVQKRWEAIGGARLGWVEPGADKNHTAAAAP